MPICHCSGKAELTKLLPLEEVPRRSGTLGLCLQYHPLSRDVVLVPFPLSKMSWALYGCCNSLDLESPR